MPTRPSPSQPDLFGAESPAPTEPSGLAYQQEFITQSEELKLINMVLALPLRPASYKQYTAQRRVVNFGWSYDYDNNVLLDAPQVPAEFDFLRERVAAWSGVAPSSFAQLLVADYAPRTPLGWNRDVPDYEVIAGISLGSAATLRFRPYPPTQGRKYAVRELQVEPRSAYSMRGPARWKWQHSVPPTPGQRWSLTFRTLAKR